MPNLSSIFNFKYRNPLAAVGIFAALVVVVETCLALLPEIALVQSFHTSVLPPQPPTWQIMGDSVARDGIVATQLNATLPANQSVFNLATAATGPEFPYFQLQREIAAGKAPKAIIYAPSPHTFASKRVPLLVGAFCTWPEILEVARARLEPFDVLYGIFCKLSYTLRNREQITELLKSRVTGESDDNPISPANNPTLKPPQPRWTSQSLNATYKRRFEVQPFNDHFLMKFLRLARANRIPVYWVTMPVIPAVHECRKEYDFETDYFRFLDALKQQRLVLELQRDFLVWDEVNFKDQTHLNSDGAQRFTQLLDDKLTPLPQQPSY